MASGCRGSNEADGGYAAGAVELSREEWTAGGNNAVPLSLKLLLLSQYRIAE